jgi:hypothetical protein
MGLLRPREERPRLRSKVRAYTVLRCPLNGHQVGLCRGLCTPSTEGLGLCGRIAAHGLVGRTQAAIMEHARRHSPFNPEAVDRPAR